MKGINETMIQMFGYSWFLKDTSESYTKAALQRRAFLLAELARTRSAARQASMVPLARPELRRRLMPADKL